MPPHVRWRLSDIPFSATVGAVRVGRVDGEFVINPTYSERAATTLNIMVVGHKDGIVMIESGAKEETEEVILAAIEFAHGEIKKIVAAIDELVAKAGKPKRAFTAPDFDEGYYMRSKPRLASVSRTHSIPRRTARPRAMVWSSKSRMNSPQSFPRMTLTPRRSSALITNCCASASSVSR